MLARRLVMAGFALALGLTVSAQEPKDNPAAKPLNRDNARHKQFLKVVEKGEGDVIFLGDSITQGWEGQKKTWEAAFGAFKMEGVLKEDGLHVHSERTNGRYPYDAVYAFLPL